MKRKFIKKFSVYILLLVMILQTSLFAFAHPASQAGILAKTYHSQYGDYYVGGEDVGWSIDEERHTNGTTITYTFSSSDPYLTSDYMSYVTNGASRWSGTVSIVRQIVTATGLISTYHNLNTPYYAVFYNLGTNSAGHFTSWEIKMNRAKSLSANILAHELGHAIGLNDLYASKNSGKLMYGYVDGMASYPTLSDLWGAKVITGSHTTHSWGYKFWDTNELGNMHIKYCTSCNGLTSQTSQCTYTSSNNCTVCGTNKYTPITP